jgi:transposase
MSKYDVSFKLAVIEHQLAGGHSLSQTSSVFDLDDGTIRKWVSVYSIHGLAGLTKKFSHYSAAFKLSVLQRMWAEGLSFRQTAALFNIRSANCLGTWERCYKDGGIDALTPRRKGRPKSMPDEVIKPPTLPKTDDAKFRDELMKELEYLRMENAYLKKLEALTRGKQPKTKRLLFKR